MTDGTSQGFCRSCGAAFGPDTANTMTCLNCGTPVVPPGQAPPSPQAAPSGHSDPWSAQNPAYPGVPTGQPGYGQATDPEAPFGRHPMTGEPFSDKQKLVAGLLQIFLGGVGAGRWYLGDNGVALAQLFTCGGCGIWALIDGIQMLTGNVRDKYGRPLRD